METASNERALVPVEPRPADRRLMSYAELKHFAQAAADSLLFNGVDTFEQALVRAQMGVELGIGPAAALVAIHVIDSKPALSANLVAARVKASGRYDYRVSVHTEEECAIAFYEKGPREREELGISVFTSEDAKRAGLIKERGGWQKYPKALLFARALTQGVRWYCPDVLFGVPAYTPDELGGEPAADDVIDVEVTPTKKKGKKDAAG